MHQMFSEDAPREIVKGIGITSLILGICVYLPFFGFILSLLLPLPIVFYRLKLGRKNGSWVTVGTLLVIIFFLGSLSFDFFFFAQLLILGLALGEMLERKLSVEKTILYACGVFWASALMVLFFASLASRTQIMTMVSGYVGINLEHSLVLYEKLGVPQEQVETIRNSMDLIQYVLVRLIPGITTSIALFIAWSNLLISRPVLTAAKISFPDFGNLNTWKAPELLVWAVISCGIMLMIPEKGIKLSAINLLIILMTAYFFQGIAIVSFFFEKKDIPILLRIILYGFIGMQILLFWLIIAMGFFDMWLDFRKLHTLKEN